MLVGKLRMVSFAGSGILCQGLGLDRIALPPLADPGAVEALTKRVLGE